MDSIPFGNRNYQIREVEIDGVGIRTIASTALNKRILTEAGSYTSDEARRVDEQIYFFVKPGKLSLNDGALRNYVKRYCS